MATLSEGKHAGEFVLSEASGYRSHDEVTLLSGQVVVAGQVLGAITVGTTAASAAKAGNTGDGTMGTVTVSAGAKPGVYTLRIETATANAGTFEVEDPDGVPVGVGTVAVAFSAGGLAFTLADGATDFVVGDGFNITVAAGSRKYVAHDVALTNGAQVAAAIAWDNYDATDGDMTIAVVARDEEVIKSGLTWKSGASADDIAAGIADLKKVGILVLDNSVHV